MSMPRAAAILAAGTMLATLPPEPVAAQIGQSFGDGVEQRVGVSVRAGPSVPVDQLGDIADVGTAIGADVAIPVADRLAVSLDGNVDMLTAGEAGPADMRLWHYGAGLQYDLSPEETPWSVVLHGGANATTLDTEEFAAAPDGDFTETYFGLSSGLELGYEVTENVQLAVRGSGFFVFADEEETDILFADVPGPEAFATAITVPVTAEIHIAMPN